MKRYDKMDNHLTGPKWFGRYSVLVILWIAVLAGGTFLPAVHVSGAEPEDSELKTVRVGYLIYDGFQEGEGDEPKSGYGYEYLQQIAYFSGWKYEWQLF